MSSGIFRKQDGTPDQSLICGYCLLPVSEESSVTIGQNEVPLCHDSDVSCYELVTVYGRPLADGRRVGTYTMTKGQLLLPGLADY